MKNLRPYLQPNPFVQHANNNNIDFEKVTNIAVGYDMDDKPDKDDIEVQRNSEFTPQWYVEYDGNWYAYKDGRLE